jgi:hypothetical protein
VGTNGRTRPGAGPRPGGGEAPFAIEGERDVALQPGGHIPVGLVELGPKAFELPGGIGVQVEPVEHIGAHGRPALSLEQARPRVRPAGTARTEHVR